MVQFSVGGGKDGLVGHLRAEVKVEIDLLEKAERLARQVADYGGHGPRLPPQEIAALGIRVAGLDGSQELPGVVGQLLQRAGLAGLGLGLELRRPKVGIHEPFEMALQVQCEEQVGASDLVHETIPFRPSASTVKRQAPANYT